MSTKFRIDQKFRDFLPPLRSEERASLKAKIEREGCKEKALTVGDFDGDRVLLDGHNTLAICEELGIEPTAPVVLEFTDDASAFEWITENQDGRRNWTEPQRSYYRGKKYLEERKDAGNPNLQKTSGNSNVVTVTTLERTSEKLAKQHGTSPATIIRDAAFAEAVDAIADTQGEPTKQAILAGETGMTKKEIVKAAKGKTPILCDRCKRTGAVKNCLACHELRPKKGKKKKPKVQPDVVVQAEPGEDHHAEETPQEEMDRINSSIESFCRQLTAFMKDCPEDHWLKDLGRREGAFRKVKDACETLRSGKCAGLCPKCNAKGCDKCHKTGRLPKMLLDTCK